MGNTILDILMVISWFAILVSALWMLVTFFIVDRRAGQGWTVIFANIVQTTFITIIPIAAIANYLDPRTSPLEKRGYIIYLSCVLYLILMLILVKVFGSPLQT